MLEAIVIREFTISLWVSANHLHFTDSSYLLVKAFGLAREILANFKAQVFIFNNH